ncbi:hypothetical protein [Afifella sp. YEN Y35]|uniref:hypothetical protein n=1 Tax=Afifella sp. YEN Y35 TaxID=3388337 RepID=UPI0039E0FBAE
MRRIDFDRKSRIGIKMFFVMSSTDLFFEHRDLLGCSFFTKDLQTGLRQWLDRETYWCIKMTSEDWQAGFARFISDNRHIGRPLELYVRWLDRIAGVKGRDRSNSLNGWSEAFHLLARRPSIAFSAENAAMHRLCMEKYIELVYCRAKPVDELMSSIMKEWDCYPDSEERKRHNLQAKSEWDAGIYEWVVLDDEVYVDVALGVSTDRAFFRDFIDFYTLTFSDEEKASYYLEFASIALANDLCADYGMALPLEALYEPDPDGPEK